MAGNFLHNAWYVAAEAEEIGREPFGRILLNQPVVIYRREDGTAVALEDTCPHRRAPLSEGTLQGDNIQCPYHGIVFDCAGKAVWVQGADRIHSSMKVRVYPLAERYGWLWIWMGDPVLADEAQIFDASKCADPEWATIKGMMHCKAGAMVAIDNLMDLSHTAFVHAGTVGAKDDLNPELVWERKENWIKGTRKAARMTPSATYVDRGAVGFQLSQTKTMAYTPPYNCNVDIFTKEADCEPGQERFNEQFLTYNMITPETDRTCFYFWANTRNFNVDNEAYNELNARNAAKLLGEDRKIIESVQRMTDLNPAKGEVDLAADAGGLQARRILRRLIEAERALATAAE